MEIGTMDLLSRLSRALEIKRRERTTIRELSQLSDRDLAGLNLSRGDIRDVAWLAARIDGFDSYAYDDQRAARAALASGVARPVPDRLEEGLAAPAGACPPFVTLHVVR